MHQLVAHAILACYSFAEMPFYECAKTILAGCSQRIRKCYLASSDWMAAASKFTNAIWIAAVASEFANS